MEELYIDEDLDGIKTAKRSTLFPVIVAYGIIVHAIVFKFLGWPGSILMLIGSGFAFACAVNNYLNEQKLSSLLLSIFWLSWTAYIVYGVFYNGGQPFNQNGMVIYGCSILIYFVGLRIFRVQ
ncbi:MAG: hypothetical protein MRY83_07590 [Flavobacteriales bacterium]|nr:hypothetical protein [Flavobacteriales bacterium]